MVVVPERKKAEIIIVLHTNNYQSPLYIYIPRISDDCRVRKVTPLFALR